jgi:hypothetical protein
MSEATLPGFEMCPDIAKCKEPFANVARNSFKGKAMRSPHRTRPMNLSGLTILDCLI